MASAIQYRGITSILQGFDEAEISTWAVVYNRQIIGRSAGKSQVESREELETFLKSIAKSNTTAQYTLNLYDGLKDKKKIRLTLEPDISANFVIYDSEDNPSPVYSGRRNMYADIVDRLDALDAKMALRTKAEEEDSDEEDGVGETGGGILGAINKILDNPRVQEDIGTWLIGLAKSIKISLPQLTPPPMTKEVAQMGNTGQQLAEGEPAITQEQAEKIQRSVQILASLDPNLGDHLEKIALVAQQNPRKYNNLIGMLNTFL